LKTDQLTNFLLDLADIWVKNGYGNGVKIGPFNELIRFFIEGNAELPCIWRDNCVNPFRMTEKRLLQEAP
jgi:uncharacterized protein